MLLKNPYSVTHNPTFHASLYWSSLSGGTYLTQKARGQDSLLRILRLFLSLIKITFT